MYNNNKKVKKKKEKNKQNTRSLEIVYGLRNVYKLKYTNRKRFKLFK